MFAAMGRSLSLLKGGGGRFKRYSCSDTKDGMHGLESINFSLKSLHIARMAGPSHIMVRGIRLSKSFPFPVI